MKLLLVLFALVAPALSARLPYIVGGQDVSPVGKWPWQASLQFFSSHICGAALISNKWVVTAAHCVGYSASYYEVVLGMHDRVTMQQGNPTRVKVSRIISHPGWESSGYKGFPNDIAVIELASSAQTSSAYIGTVSLASSGQNFEGSTCYITGWGRLSGNSGSPNILQEAQVDVYSQSQCQSSWGSIPIGGYHICVGKRGQSSACSGDSGGPLTCQTGSGWTLAGVTSWGRSDCSVYSPSVYANIAYFRDWIRTNAGV